MRIKVREGSDYLRGLLVLGRKDREITVPEIRLIEHVGRALGFCPKFCADAIREILDNKYILDAPPEFSSRLLAEKFVKDGLVLASSDNQVHPAEAEWLKSVVEKNGLCLVWFRQEVARAMNRNRHSSPPGSGRPGSRVLLTAARCRYLLPDVSPGVLRRSSVAARALAVALAVLSLGAPWFASWGECRESSCTQQRALTLTSTDFALPGRRPALPGLMRIRKDGGMRAGVRQ